MERDDSTESPPDMEKEGHKPDANSMKAYKYDVDVDQSEKG